MSKSVVLTEDWIKEKLKISDENLEDIKTLIIQGNYEEKITYLGNALLHFSRLKILDLSRNCLKSIKGIDHIISLEVLNLYYNCIEDINELRSLEHNVNLKDLDLRLNPVSRLNSDYRLYLTHLLPKLKTLDCRSIRDAERKAAIAYFNLDNQTSELRSTSPTYRTGHTKNFKEPIPDSNLHMYKRSPNHSKPIPETMMPYIYDVTSSDELIKSRLQMDDSDLYDINTKTNDPWTNYFLRTNMKPNGNVKTLDPTRGIKQAEFYGKKERLQTEIDLSTTDTRENGVKVRGQEEKVCYTNGKDVRESVHSSNKVQHQTTKGPRIPPRGKRYTPSSSTLVANTKNGNEKQMTTEQHLSAIQTFNRNTSDSSPQNMTGDINRTNKHREFGEGMDNSFLMVLKNFIEDAVSESFARHKSNEKRDASLVKQGKQSTIASSPSRRTEQLQAMLNRTTFGNENSNGKRNNSFSKSHNMESCTTLDMHRDYHDSDHNGVDKNKKDLMNENLRLTDEVERLKSRLRAYEELAISNPSATATTTAMTTINAKTPLLPSAIQMYDEPSRRKMIESQTLLETTPLKRTMSLMSSTPNISQVSNSKRPDYLEFEQAPLFPSTMHHTLKFYNSTDPHCPNIARPKFMI